MSGTFKAFLATESGGKVTGGFTQLTESELPDGEVTVAVAYSTVNYKDGLALDGNRARIMRRLPMVPGIDLAGTVEASSVPAFRPGDKVVATGWGLGESHWGGYAQKARVKAEWLVPLPAGLTLAEAMAIGTAGLTAMLSALALERAGLRPGARPVLVTGAAGGVGSTAVAILAALGYRVAAETGRPELAGYLRGLGASEIVPREELAQAEARPLEAVRWAGAVDAVGGAILATVLRQLEEGGTVAASGNTAGLELKTTVLPFILRGVSLIGINSPVAPARIRGEAWLRLAHDLPRDKLAAMTTVVPFAELLRVGAAILAGQVRGRTVIDLNA